MKPYRFKILMTKLLKISSYVSSVCSNLLLVMAIKA